MTKPIAPTGPAFTGPADLIIGCGSHIFAAEVERILTAYPVVQDAAVIGIRGAELALST
jgi:acyl-coenzyme A synthetase/AMP-(fatty) acid ligase